MVAKGISPIRPDNAGVEAGKIVFRKIKEYADKGITFAFESTLSATGNFWRIEGLNNTGYRIVIYYLQLVSEGLANECVKCRVQEGGHNVLDADVRRRFKRSWQNFTKRYRNLANEWIVHDNSGDDPFVLERSK